MFGKKKKEDPFFKECEAQKAMYETRNEAYNLSKVVHSLENGFTVTSVRTDDDYIVIKHEKIGGKEFAFEGYVRDFGYCLVKVSPLEDGSVEYSGFISDSGKYEAIDGKNFEVGIYCAKELDEKFKKGLEIAEGTRTVEESTLDR